MNSKCLSDRSSDEQFTQHLAKLCQFSAYCNIVYTLYTSTIKRLQTSESFTFYKTIELSTQVNYHSKQNCQKNYKVLMESHLSVRKVISQEISTTNNKSYHETQTGFPSTSF